RQDASLQAGHFNDFIQILLLRGALLAAIKDEPTRTLRDDNLTHKVLEKLNLEPSDYASNPGVKGFGAQNTLHALRDVLGSRLDYAVRRGWRSSDDNLEPAHLLEMCYKALEGFGDDVQEWQQCHPLQGPITPELRLALVPELPDQM